MSNQDFGARIYNVNGDRILIKQTIKKSVPNTNLKRYVLDCLPDGTHKERHLDKNNDKAIADAVRDAINGQLA